MKILLTGYYGFGNYGDDVLLKVSHHVLRERYPHAQIDIMTAAARPDYLSALLEDDIRIHPIQYLGHYELIVHGGGGVFSDFAQHSWGNRLIERMMRLIGFPAYLALIKQLRLLLRKPLNTADKRVAIGVGVGTYSPGSPMLRTALTILQDLDVIGVRDVQSQSNLKRYARILSAQMIRGSDLAFLADHWQPSPLATPNPEVSKPKLGFIFRDWPHLYHAARMAELVNRLQEWQQHYELTIFLFEQTSDQVLMEHFNGFKLALWQPEKMTFADYTQRLAQQDVVLTSRAHGAICAACLGVPSVIIEIEPKLRTVHEMLPNASQLVSPYPFEGWAAALKTAMEVSPKAIQEDVAYNNAQSTAMIEQALGDGV